MRLVEGKKNEALQVKIKEKEQLIVKKIKQYHKLANEINTLRRDWRMLIESERTVNGEEWMLSDQMRADMMEYEMLPAWLKTADKDE